MRKTVLIVEDDTEQLTVILCFLHSRFMEVEKEGVTVSYRINIGDMECGVPTYKIVELLGNLIKNAVEAVKEREDGSIHVRTGKKMIGTGWCLV